MEKLLISKGNKPRNGLVKKCLFCKDKFYTYPSRINHIYCSVKCRGEMMTIKFSGENSNTWKGGISDPLRRIRSSKKFKVWRESVFKRDDHTCQDCGNKNIDIHPHHIKPFILFPELRFELSNGITLCPLCHKRADNLNRKKYDFKQFYKKLLNK
jgi:hypothetical protein